MTRKSAHALRAELHQANIQMRILEKKVAAAEACERGDHMKPNKAKPCILCGA